MSCHGEPLIEVEGLTKRFPVSTGVFSRRAGEVHAVEDVTLSVRRGETLGIVGESGCGKSTTARLMLKLIEPTAGHDPLRRPRHHEAEPARRCGRCGARCRWSSRIRTRRSTRARRSARSSGSRTRSTRPRATRRRRVRELMDRCGMNPEHYNRYPHEFSGGQRQRIGVARALALRPKLIVCDEPVSALDVSIQAQILNLLESLQSEFGLTYVFISHDLSVIRQISDRIAVMYLGRVVELVGLRDALRPAAPSVHRVPALGRAAHRASGARASASCSSGDVPSPGRAALGLRVPPALPQGAPDDRRQRRARGLPRRPARSSTGGENGCGGHATACWHPLASVDELRPVASA